MACVDILYAGIGRSVSFPWIIIEERPGKVENRTTGMKGLRKSDSLIVSKKPLNKICDNKHMAEEVEKSELAKGNLLSKTRAGHRAWEPCHVSLARYGRQQHSLCVLPKAGAQCGSSACWDLCGGCRETGIPTATDILIFY